MTAYAEIRRFDDTDFGQVTYIGDADFVPSFGDGEMFAVGIDGLVPQPVPGWYYDGADFSETLPPGATVPRRTLLAPELWMKKFTSTERSTVWALCAGETVPGVTVTQPQRYRLAAFRDITLTGEPIPLHANETETVIDALETIGAIDPGRADIILER